MKKSRFSDEQIVKILSSITDGVNIDSKFLISSVELSPLLRCCC